MPSAVSRQISHLETSLKVQLFVRTTRTLRLSEAGQSVAQYAQDMLAAAKSASTVSEQNSQPQGLIRLSSPKGFVKQVIQPLIGPFLRRYPDITLQIIVTDRPTDLLQEDIDLAIRITDQPPQGLIAKPLMFVEQVLVASGNYLTTHGTPAEPQELIEHDCIYLGEHASDNRWVFQKNQQTQTVTVHGRYIVNNTEMRLAAALDELGIASMPLFTAQEALADGRLHRVLPDWDLLTAYRGNAYLLYPPNRYLAPKLRVLIDYLQASLHRQT